MSTKQLTRNWLSRLGLSLSLVASILTGCGGGGGSSIASVGSGGTGTGVTVGSGNGTVTGFGSVYVDGIKYDDSATSVETERDENKSVALTEVKLGQHVEIEFENSTRAKRIVIVPEVIGKVDSLDTANNKLVVAGQTVQVNPAGSSSPTVLEGLASLSDLAVGNVVEVHGVRDANNVIQATRLELRPSFISFTRVVGLVANLDTTAKTFTLGNINVDYSGVIALVNMPTSGLVNGLRVAVWSNQPIANGAIKADVIRSKKIQSNNGNDLVIGGLISDFVSVSDFKVGGQAVDASTASFDNGTAADLVNGKRVRIKGAVTNNVVKATSVKFFKVESDLSVELTGPITDFVSNSSFKVRGVTVDASAITPTPTLANGTMVEVKGSINANVLLASSLEIKSGSSTGGGVSGTVKVKGVVYELDATTKLFKVNGQRVRFTDVTVTNLNNGNSVEVEGIMIAGVLVASKVEVSTDDGVTTADVRGFVSDYVSTTDFRVAGQKVTTTNATVYKNGVASDLANLKFVRVKGSVSSGVLTATELEFKS